MSVSAPVGGPPPGPRGYPLLGLFPRARKDPLAFFLDAARTHGDVVGLPLGVRRIFLLTHPDHVRAVLQDTGGRFLKRVATRRITPLFGASLTTVDGEDWVRRRHLLRSLFTPPRMAALVPLIVETTDAMLERWCEPAETGRPFDVLDEMTELTRAIIIRMLFGEVPDEEARSAGRAITIVSEYVNRGLWSPLTWLPRLPTPRRERYERAVEALDAFLSRWIDGARGPGAQGTLLSALRAARDAESQRGFDGAELRDELKALFVAGHATTASGLAWVWYLLSGDVAAQGRLRREACAALGARRPTAQDLADLEYARMVIDETLRLYPPTWITARTTTVAVDFDGYRIPAHATVLLSPFVTHRDPRFWEDADRFAPERFRHGHAARPRYAYFPFGGGPRACIGSAFALIEMQVVVAMVARRYELALAPGWRVAPEPGTVLVPRGGLRIVVRPAAAGG
jgi:cytochrome P450